MKFIVTAGPTREYLDPARFLSNPSSGRMGFAIARAAAMRGHSVTLVSGPVSLRTPRGVRRIDVVSAREMFEAVSREASEFPSAVLVAAAAVADWRPARTAKSKLKKSAMTGVLRLVRNPDILKRVKLVRKIGFAAETGDAVAEAARKCRAKGARFIVANDITERGSGFGVGTNRVAFVNSDGSAVRLPLMSKLAVATRIVAAAESVFAP